MQPQTILLAFIFFLYGIVIGSFVNVCIYRIPKKENIAVNRSHCMSCNHVLAWYDHFSRGFFCGESADTVVRKYPGSIRW